MNLIILPGSSAKHKIWLESAKSAFSSHFEKVFTFEYSHWESGGEFDMDAEMEKLKILTGTIAGDYIIFAKSIGTILTIKGVSEGFLKPAKSVFAGFPVEILKEDSEEVRQIVAAISKYQIPTVIIQKTKDPYGSANYVRAFLDKYDRKIQVVEIPGEDHVYEDFKLVSDCLM